MIIDSQDASVDDKDPVALRSFVIIEAVAFSHEPLSIEEIADITNIPRSTLHRLVKAMVQGGVLMPAPGGKHYSSGERVIALMKNSGTHDSLYQERHAILQLLVDEIGETCNFTTLDATDVVYVDRVESKWPLRLHLKQGSRVPLHCTSSGKLFLSHMPAEQRRRLLHQRPLTRYTPKTITDPHLLTKELAEIRRSNLSTDDEGYLLGLISVAVPVFGKDRKVIGAVAVHAPLARLPLVDALGYAGILRRAASDLGRIYRQFS